MNILVVGSGGREHALAWKLAQSDQAGTVFVAPGNAGTALEPGCQNVSISIGDFAGLASFAKRQNVELTIVGPEAPLVDGIRDYFDQRGLPCFAPSRLAAQLEGSKSFAKEFLLRHGIPTAHHFATTDLEDAMAYIKKQSTPIVVKADGLAAGKGVVVAQSHAEAIEMTTQMMKGQHFGNAGAKVVIEDFLAGEEASFIVIADGERILPFASSQDHKPVYNGDKGSNTGGMGAYSPAPVVTKAIHQRIMTEIIEPTIRGMAEEGNPYQGFLYAGLMITSDGTPNVIEFNCRFGDPEAQPIMMRLESDLVELCLSALGEGLADTAMRFLSKTALGVVMASDGYPGEYQTGMRIEGLSVDLVNTKIFHAGTQTHGDGTIVTSGGRVLCVVGLGKDVAQAQKRAYERVAMISWDGGGGGAFYRTDIGHRALDREAVI